MEKIKIILDEELLYNKVYCPLCGLRIEISNKFDDEGHMRVNCRRCKKEIKISRNAPSKNQTYLSATEKKIYLEYEVQSINQSGLSTIGQILSIQNIINPPREPMGTFREESHIVMEYPSRPTLFPNQERFHNYFNKRKLDR